MLIVWRNGRKGKLINETGCTTIVPGCIIPFFFNIAVTAYPNVSRCC